MRTDAEELGYELVGPEGYDPMWDEVREPVPYYDKKLRPLTLRQWCTLFEKLDYKRVAFDDLGSVRVSTVWLGADHSWGNGPVLIFETMVFSNQKTEEEFFRGEEFGWRTNDPQSWEDIDCVRYTTKEQALAGHAEVVEKWSRRLNQ